MLFDLGAVTPDELEYRIDRARTFATKDYDHYIDVSTAAKEEFKRAIEDAKMPGFMHYYFKGEQADEAKRDGVSEIPPDDRENTHDTLFETKDGIERPRVASLLNRFDQLTPERDDTPQLHPLLRAELLQTEQYEHIRQGYAPCRLKEPGRGNAYGAL